MQGSALSSVSIRKVAIASFIGTTIEWYDFFLYGTASALVFGRLFFPNYDPLTGTLAAFGTYAVGFIARPIGGIVCGHFGDRIGRRSMLVLTLVHVAILFIFGSPEWKPLATGYLGLLLLGASFISLGLFISSLTKNQIVAGMVSFAVFLLFWVANWFGSISSGGWAADVANYISVIDHFDDFSKGVIDTKHLVYYLSFISFGLYLTAKSVDSERWRG